MSKIIRSFGSVILTMIIVWVFIPLNCFVANATNENSLNGKASITDEDGSTIEKSEKDNVVDFELDYEPGVVLVGYNKPHPISSIIELLSDFTIEDYIDQGKCLFDAVQKGRPEDKERLLELKAEYEKNYVIKISEKTKESVLEAIDILIKQPDVKYAIPDYYYDPAVTTPNDYSNYSLTGLERIEARSAWDTFTGSTSVNVGIIDTGIDNSHPDLSDNVNMSLAYDAQNMNNIDTFDYNGHGTHVSGIVGAKGNNSIGIVGVNWNISLVPIKIVKNNSGTGSATSTTMVRAVEYAISNNLPICNMSYGTPESDPFYNAVRNYNGLFVIAAGNDGKKIDDIEKYTRLNDLGNVIFVANSDNNTGVNEALVSSSNYGLRNVAIAAPGKNVTSTIPLTGPGSISGTIYAKKSGTSMSAPFVTGVAALLKGKYPSMTTSNIKKIILEGVNCVPKIQGLVSTGRLNANNAIKKTNDSSFMIFQPNDGETMKSAIIRCLEARPASQIKSIKLLGNAEMNASSTSNDSASTVLPNLVNIDLSSFTGKIETSSFHRCNMATTVIFPEDEFCLPAYCFYCCDLLKTIYRANNPIRTLNEADLTGLQCINGSGSPIAVQTQCFQGCVSLSTVRMPNTGKLRFSQFVFKDCTSLSTVYLDTFESVPGEADLTEMSHISTAIFENTAIESIKLPKDADISARAFKNCENLKTIQIHPAQISTPAISEDSFYGVNSACTVFTNQQLQNNNSFVFHRTSTTFIPKQVNSLIIWSSANDTISSTINRYLETTASSIKHLVIIGNATFDVSTSTTSANVLPNLETADLSLYTGILTKYMFYNCANLKMVIRNTNHTRVRGQCFMNCERLKTILVNNKYPKKGDEADLSNLTGSVAVDTQSFQSCTNLTTIMLPSTSIGIPKAFCGCLNLTTIYKEGNEKESKTFDLTGITTFWPDWGSNFSETNVSKVKLPKNVDIAKKIFYNCSNLNTICFDETQTLAVAIGSQAFYYVNPSCVAKMNETLVADASFILPRSTTENIPKETY